MEEWVMSTEEIRSIIEDLSRQLQAAINSQNPDEITNLYTDEPKFLPRGGDIPQFDPLPENRWSKEYINTYWNNVFKAPTMGCCKYLQRISNIEVLDYIAYEIGTYHLAADTGVGNDLEEGVYFILWKKEHEQWKIEVHILNTISNPKW
jgi:ketosteroid isomerase-like protein